MFKNNVFKVSVNTSKWIKAASIRAIKTMSQVAISTIGTAAVFGAVDWRMVASASVLSGVLSVLTSIAGLPEVAANEE